MNENRPTIEFVTEIVIGLSKLAKSPAEKQLCEVLTGFCLVVKDLEKRIDEKPKEVTTPTVKRGRPPKKVVIDVENENGKE